MRVRWLLRMRIVEVSNYGLCLTECPGQILLVGVILEESPSLKNINLNSRGIAHGIRLDSTVVWNGPLPVKGHSQRH